MQGPVRAMGRGRSLTCVAAALLAGLFGGPAATRGPGLAAPIAPAAKVPATGGASAPAPAIGLCGIAYPRGATGAFETPAVYSPAPAKVAIGQLYPAAQVQGFFLDPRNDRLYVKTLTAIVVVDALSRAVVARFPLPSHGLDGSSLEEGNANGSVLVGPNGDIYFFMLANRFFMDLVQLGPTGAQRWDVRLPGTANGLFGWHDAAGKWAAAYIARGPSPPELVSPSGAPVRGSEPVLGNNNEEFVAGTPNGGLIYNDGNYIRALGRSGSPVPSSALQVADFGNELAPSLPDAPGAPLTFGPGGVVEVGPAIYVVAPDGGIDVFTETGVFQGEAPGSVLNLSVGSSLYYDPSGRDLIYEGRNGIASVTMAALHALVTSPAPPTQDGFGDTLGVGAALSTSATANYFHAGTTPAVTASFDPWWRTYPDPLRLSYWVADNDQVTADALPAPTVVPLTWPRARSGLPLDLAIAAPALPGVYLVNADLVDATHSQTIGSTCLTYSVGTAGDRLDFAHLAPGEDYGGPGPERGVELAAEIGTGAMREQLSLATLLPDCSSSRPTKATCGPSALQHWSVYDPATEQAAKKAQELHVGFEVQVGQEEPVDEGLVASGYWGPDVMAIMEHLSRSAPDLRDVEAWNEPNTGPFSPQSYVRTVLAPFYDAVRAANRRDRTALQVIGGTVVGMDVPGWWAGIGEAGGFKYMNIAGIHPYPGYDRSFEEEGTPAALQALKALMARYGAASMPVWDTEQGWWSDGEEAFYDVGDWAAREWMWLRSFGITDWDYFITEGQFSGVGADFSLIDAADGDYYVKPGAIGLMTVSALLGNRPFVRYVALGTPHAYGMLFGRPAHSRATDDVLAVWTDDLRVAGEVSLSEGRGPVVLRTTGALGQAGTLSVAPSSPAPVELSGAPLYISVPAGDVVTVSPVESFGPNLALSSEGATATASSSQGGLNVPGAVIRGAADASNGGGLDATTAWASRAGDRSPWLQVDLPAKQTVDRVLVSTSSLGSVLPGLRDYTVSLDENGHWARVATMTDEFFDRMQGFSFPAATGVSAIRLVSTALDFNSEVGGLAPYYWTPSFPDYAVVYSVEAYRPGTWYEIGEKAAKQMPAFGLAGQFGPFFG